MNHRVVRYGPKAWDAYSDINDKLSTPAVESTQKQINILVVKRLTKRDQVAAKEEQQMGAEALAASTIDDILADEAFAVLAYTLAAGMKPTSEARDQPDLPLLLDRRCHNPPRRPRDE
ncbi:hypothetical protein BHE74_00010991 [Ensete ventricosum]|nr:hypothetical protein GW17_00011819 [Ensete ventricosum]RWW80665.1 hypothetical protein BHE74_00010991 [Ensete ventricosum]RZR83977.1 hypothetical protein BHM03_00010703 [Ensete ventricosum]